MTDLERAPVLRVVPGPSDINANGHIFGGWVLSQMDIAAGIVASRRAIGTVASGAFVARDLLAPFP
jgi:acyl-CoA thioesterase YciA